jgi:hypothetical protein
MLKWFVSFLAVLLAGCASHGIVNYIVSSHSPYVCCRTVRYSTWEFDKTEPSRMPGKGVVVRLLGDTLNAECAHDASVGVTIANNSDLDIFIPFSKELEGMRVKLYPWRLLYEEGRPIRLARQLQYNDIIEREDALARFFRLPAGRQVTLEGTVPQRWLCLVATSITDEYLGLELNPTFYADRARALRGAEYKRDPQLLTTVPFRYDVAYSTLRYIDSLPVASRASNSAGDTTRVTIAVKEEPAQFLDASQLVAKSNEITLRITD